MFQRVFVQVAFLPLWFLPEYRGSTRICRSIARLASQGGVHSVAVAPSNAKLKFSASDHYWLRTLSSLYGYEPDVCNALNAAAESGHTVLVDGGANLGYFSAAYSSEFQQVISVEAAPTTFKALEANVEKLENVTALHKAVWHKDDEFVSMVVEASEHQSGHIDKSDLHKAGEEAVGTVTIDELLRRRGLSESDGVIIKLDVEGAEANALAGATKAIADGAVFVLEEHGKDTECLTYQALQKYVPGCSVAFLTHGGAIEVSSIEKLRALKRHRGVGYNILATSGSSARGRQLVEALVSGRAPTAQERIWSGTQFLGWTLPAKVQKFFG